MRLPAPLLRRNPNVHKNDFGHVLVLAGSPGMIGAAALTSLSAMRAGAGLVTVGIPQSLNAVLQKKLSPVIMTLSLKETKEQTLSLDAFRQIHRVLDRFQVIAIGPGLSRNRSTQKLILKIIGTVQKPLVIDADALWALVQQLKILKKTSATKILTPHPGEMSKLLGLSKELIEKNRLKTASEFAQKYHCTLVLKGHKTIVASSKGKVFLNKTGNAGMATAGSGDVLTGMITALLAQGLTDFDSAKYAVMLHGKSGDWAAKNKTKASLIATDIIDSIPQAFKSLGA